MRRLARLAVTVLGAAVVVAAGDPPDPRSHELLGFDCRTGEHRSDLTLFGNGTLRLREGTIGEEDMLLSEIDPDGLAAYVRRLRQESLGEDLEPPPSVEGLFTEQCVLTIDIPDGPSGTAAFGAFDSLSLPLSRLVSIARELVVVARANTRVDGLSYEYVPRAGDVLLHRDGNRYLVRGLTSDGRGVELIGLDQPLTIYVAVEALADEFLAVEESGS